MADAAPRVALLCSGLGRVYRGYERFADELFRALGPTTRAVLFKGGGASGPRERVVGGLHRDGAIARGFGRLSRDRFVWEAMSFGLLTWPRVLHGGFDVVHSSEPSLNLLFSRFDRWSRRPPRRLFSHALDMAPQHCLGCHHLHQTSPVAYARAVESGVPEGCMTLLPYGVDTATFAPADAAMRRALRRRWGLGDDEPVVLCVSALNRIHKRVDRLVHAVAELKRDCRLLLCGAVEDASLLEEARALLGGRVRHLYVAPAAMRDVYAVADVFVLPSLVEGFGLVVLEAALCGLPVVVHDSPHFRWLLGAAAAAYPALDDADALREALCDTLENLSTLGARARAARTSLVERFDWSRLIPGYLAMYERVAASAGPTIAERVNAR